MGDDKVLKILEMCYINNAGPFDPPHARQRNTPFHHALMTNRIRTIFGLLFSTAMLIASIQVVSAQDPRPPMLQDLQVQREPVQVLPSSPPLVVKTGSAQPAFPVGLPSSTGIRTLFPVLAEVEVPGTSGILVESLEGNVVAETNAGAAFNPASNVKIATAFAVLKTFGPNHRFATQIYTDGAVNAATQTLTGNIYVTGKDPMFGYQHAVAVAQELNRLGIRFVSGDLIVTDNFVMNYSGSPAGSAQMLYATLDMSKRSAAATRNWTNYLSHSGQLSKVNGTPSVSFTGALYVQPIPSTLQHLFTHESTEMREILKVTLCYSNNFLSERLGDLVGGPYGVARLVQQFAVVPQHEFSLATASGLGYNRVTPNAMMKLLRTFRTDLTRYKMTFNDIMPVAGIDKGTLEGRFDTDFARGSVVGKTGTLGNTDGGVSSLAGEINTRNGRLLFVIFNQRGGVARFRSFQNYFVSLVQGQFGGAQAMQYDATSLETRMTRSRVVSPNSPALRGD